MVQVLLLRADDRGVVLPRHGHLHCGRSANSPTSGGFFFPIRRAAVRCQRECRNIFEDQIRPRRTSVAEPGDGGNWQGAVEITIRNIKTCEEERWRRARCLFTLARCRTPTGWPASSSAMRRDMSFPELTCCATETAKDAGSDPFYLEPVCRGFCRGRCGTVPPRRDRGGLARWP